MTDEELEARLRRHYADRAAREALPATAGLITPGDPSTGRRRWLALVAAAAAAVLLLGGVVVLDDDEDNVDASDGPTSSITTSTTTEPTSTTIATTTSTAPEPSDFALVAAVSGIMGWWDGTQWVQLEREVQPPAFDGLRFTLVGVGGEPTEAVASPGAPSELCYPGATVEMDGLTQPELSDPPPIAVHGVADPLPRRPTIVRPAAEDVDAAREIVASRGIEDDDPRISQLLRADLDGDGVDEQLMTIERFDDVYGEAGDYSIVAVRTLVDGEVTTAVLHESSVTDPGRGDTLYVGTVSAVADLNGDGTLEVVVYAYYYEGSGTSVVSIDASGTSTLLLSSGCGS